MFDDDLPFSARDLEDALPDYIALRSGRTLIDAHPIASELSSGRLRTQIGPILARIAGMEFSPATMNRTLTASDVGSAMGSALTKIAGIEYAAQASETAQITYNAPTRGIRPASMPQLDLAELIEISPNSGGVPLAFATITTATVSAARLFASRLLLARQLVIADDVGFADVAVRQLSAMAARIQDKLVAQALDAATITATSATGISVTALGEAMGLLRTRLTPAGNKANLRGQFLVVHPDREMSAQVLAASLTYGAKPPLVQVVVNPWLTSASYLLCPPNQLAVVARPVPTGDNGLPIVLPTPNFEANEATGEIQNWDGLPLRFEAWLGASVINTLGAVKIPAA